MYRRILLAYDGSLEGRIALREGALLARACGAQVYLLSVVPQTGSIAMADSLHAGPLAQQADRYQAILDEGIQKLAALGLPPIGRLVQDDPTRAISAYARQIKADLVVVGLRKQSLAQRWWSGVSGPYLTDKLDCSVLVARSHVDEAAFQAALGRAPSP